MISIIGVVGCATNSVQAMNWPEAVQNGIGYIAVAAVLCVLFHSLLR